MNFLEYDLEEFNYRVSTMDFEARNKEGLLNSVKQKLAEALLAKTDGRKEPFSWALQEDPAFRAQPPFALLTVSSGSGETAEFSRYFERTTLDMEFLFRYVFAYLLDESGKMVAEGDIDKLLLDLSDDYNDMFGIEEEDGIDVKAFAIFVKGLSKIGHGLYSEALEVDSVNDFIEDIIDIYGGEEILEKWFVCENLGLFLYPMIYGCEEFGYSVNYFFSKEIYYYNRAYRQKVPEMLRNRLDKAISLIDNPFSGLKGDAECWYAIGDLNETGEHVVAFMTYVNSDYELDCCDMNPFVKTAYEYLEQTLPALRKAYMEG